LVKAFVAEDSALLRKEIVMTTPWRELGCKVVGQASDGQEAERLIRSLRPGLVITDICMPEKDGLELIRSLRDLEGIEYIIISAYEEFDYAMEAIRLQVKNYILKPLDDREFYDTIARAVRSLQERSTLLSLRENLQAASARNPAYLQELEENGASGENRYLPALLDFFEKHYSENIGIRDAAEALYISESYISKLLRWELGTTFSDYLGSIRIQKSIPLLRQNEMKIYEVAERVGYKDYRYFCSLFKKHVGVTPRQFRQR
jgi:two-component system response regulator YesN